MQPGCRVQEEEGEDRHGDQLEDDEVDDQSARLGREQDGAVDRRQADQVEAALLALGDEQPVDREQGREEQRRDQHPGGQLAVQAGPVEPESEDDERADREQGHRRERAQCSELHTQVLAQERAEGAHRSSSTTSAPDVAVSRSWLTTTPAGPAARTDQGLDQEAGVGVQVGIGLIEEQQLGLVQHRPADVDPLLHPRRELGHAVAAAGRHPDGLEQTLDSGRRGCGVETVQRRREAEVLPRAQVAVEQRRVAQVSHPAAKQVGLLGQSTAEDGGLPASRSQQAGEDAEQRRFSRSVRPQHRKALARLHPGADAGQRRAVAEVAAQSAQLDRRLAHGRGGAGFHGQGPLHVREARASGSSRTP